MLRDTQPKSFLLENVYGLAFKGKDEGLRLLLQGIEQINEEIGTNYKVTWKGLNAAHYGVPQLRERVFLIGHRDGKEFEFPAPTHSDPDKIGLLEENIEPYRTAWDAIGDLPMHPNEPSLKVGGKWGDLLPSIPEGQNYLWHTNRSGGENLFGWRTRYWSFMLKLSKTLPSWTIQAQPGSSIGPFHWANRKLTTLEMCRLQTFPNGLVFDCSRTDSQRLLGNAVPSLLAEVLAREIRHQLIDGRFEHDELQLLLPVRTPVPDPEQPQPLADKYMEHVGDHADHPGTGKGRMAKKRKASHTNDTQEGLFTTAAE